MNLKIHARQKGFPLPENERSRLADAIKQRGELAVLEAAGLSRSALARALAGLPVYAGTLALVRQGLGKLRSDAIADESAR
jgi:hypothetical protein